MTKIQLIPYFLYPKYQQVVDKTNVLGPEALLIYDTLLL